MLQDTGNGEIDAIVALVDEDVILFSELNDEIFKIVAQLREKGARIPAREVLERQMLERLKRIKDLDGLPRVEIRSPSQFFERLEKGHNFLIWKILIEF